MSPIIGTDMDDDDAAPRGARRSRRLNRHLRGPRSEELNIVSMIDVFAVLVFFLLVSSSIAAARLNVLSLNLLVKAKRAAPQDGNLVLLVDPDVAYEHVVEVMDAARMMPAQDHASGQAREMYPLISIGETTASGVGS